MKSEMKMMIAKRVMRAVIMLSDDDWSDAASDELGRIQDEFNLSESDVTLAEDNWNDWFYAIDAMILMRDKMSREVSLAPSLTAE